MKKNNFVKIGAGVLILVLLIAATPLSAYTCYGYDILWEEDFDDGYAASKVAVDSDDNIVICGIYDDWKGLVVKYDKDGNVIGIRCANSGGIKPTCDSPLIDLVPIDNET